MNDSKISSPCTQVCKLDANRKWCTGCHRTVDEILVWARLSEEERLRIMRGLPHRRTQLEGAS